MDMLSKNAEIIERELQWFSKILETRIKLHFDHECEYKDITEINPPQIDKKDSIYGNFIYHYELTFEERLVFLLSLIPHVKPQLLDVFFTKNATFARDFTEFGGRNSHSYQGFLPTAETALFLLAGDDLAKRLSLHVLFEADHFFARHNILYLENTEGVGPKFHGFLVLSQEIIDFVTLGTIRKPLFSTEFPAKLIETELDWDDLVLAPYTMDQVLEIKAWIEYGDILLNTLELGKKLKPGYRSLFYGPSGTGKTLTASLLGKVTNRDVYRIDLSLVVSKYIGETEKNLEKVFCKAEHKEWILFFDEADALFGKRTNISDAHDRFANQEVSYLLQRVDDYRGVIILASNMKSNLDEAFTRRFQSIIYFPMPKQSERYHIWKNAFSRKLKLEDKVNLNEIASQYEISGGAIMNAVRYATLMTLKKECDASDFYVGEFLTQFSIEELCKVINDDSYNVPLEWPVNTIGLLNELLMVSNFYDILHIKKPNIRFSNNITDLVDKTKDYRKKKFSDLNIDEQNNIKRLNRLLLEETYPQQTPKSKKNDVVPLRDIKISLSDIQEGIKREFQKESRTS